MTDLVGSICIRCGFEPLQSEEAEWWCPECWNSGQIVAPRPVEQSDALLAACRDIVTTQRSQLRAIRRGEKLGAASILFHHTLAEAHALPTEVIEERDDSAPWERPDPDYYTKPWVSDVKTWKKVPRAQITKAGWYGIYGQGESICAPMDEKPFVKGAN